MIILDTNVISELMKVSPQVSVLAWVDEQLASELFVTSIAIAEISYEINALPDGNRRRLLETAFNEAITNTFQHRIFSFDEADAHLYGAIMSRRKRLGRPMSVPDGQIAAIAVARNASLATRNTQDFSDCNLHLINPFIVQA